MREGDLHGWSDTFLGRLGTCHRGVSYRPEHLRPYPDESTITLLRATNIQNGALDFNDVQFVPSSLVSKHQVLEHGDIAVCMSNGSKALVGKSAPYRQVQREPHTIGAFCSVFKPVDQTSCEFVLHLFRSQAYQSGIDFALAGSAINNLKNSDIENMRFRLPPRAAWPRIATILTSLDTAIARTQALIEKHEQIKAGLMHDLFTRGVLPDGQLRPPKAQAPDLYRLTAAGWLPKEWGSKKLGGLVNPARPIVYGILMPGYGHAGGVPVVKVKDIRGRQIDDTNLLLTSPTIDREYRRSKLKEGDVLFTIRGSVGRLAIVPKHLEGANITQDTARIDLAGASNLFVSFYLETAPAQRFFEINTLGVAVQGINLGELRKTPIPLPPNAEQARIADLVSTAVNTLNACSAHLHVLRQQKLGLMQDLLTGKVPVRTEALVTEPDDA